LRLDHPRLRVYVLRGRRTTLLWARDRENSWEAELREGKAPEPIHDAALELGPVAGGATSVRIYDPWAGRWSAGRLRGGKVALPEFTRSVVVRLGTDPGP